MVQFMAKAGHRQGLRPGTLDLTGRQRCQWGQVLRELEAEGQLAASLPEGLGHLPPGSSPEAWIDLAEARGQVLPWLLRQLSLRAHDLRLHALGRDLGLCVDSRERLQCSPGWRHWTGLDSPAQGLSPGAGALRPALAPTMVLEVWVRRLLCLWQGGAAPASWIPRSLVLDLGADLLPLDDAVVPSGEGSAPAVRWQLAALPRHVADEPPRVEAHFRRPRPSRPSRPSSREAGPVLPRLQQDGPAAPPLDPALLGQPQAGPVLLLGADPGRPPQLCLVLLQRRGGVWRHDGRPVAMAGGALCLDLQGRLLGYCQPLSLEAVCLLAQPGD